MEQSLTFASGRAKWVFQEGDGNVVLYHDDVPVWSSNTILTPIPQQPMVPITLGGWHGNFMFNKDWYFAPSLLAWTANRRQAYYQWNQAHGYTHLWVNAQQDNWDQRYTHGGFDAFQGIVSLDHLVVVLKEIREAQLVPCVGLHDQRQTIEIMEQHDGLSRLIREDQQVIDATHEHVSLYMGLTWEINEVPNWSIGQTRNPAITRYCNEVNTHGRDVGFHWAPRTDEHGKPDVQGGFQLWNHLPSHAVRLQQYPKDCDDDELRDRTEQAVVVHGPTNTKQCIFEHSRMDVPNRPGGGQDMAEAVRRAQVCMDVIGDRLPVDRRGSMNG